MALNSQGVSPSTSATDITLDQIYDPPFRSLFVGVTGDVSLILADDTVATTVFPLAGKSVYPLSFKRINSSGTTATGLKGLR